MMDWLDIDVVDGRPALRIDAATSRPILVDVDQPSVINAGWRARGAYCGFGEFGIIDLCHENGGVAFWVIDATCRIIGSDVVALPDAVRPVFEAAIAMRLRDLVDQMLVDPEAPRDPKVRDFMRLSPELRKRLTGHVALDRIGLLQPRVVDLATCEEQSWPVTTPAGMPILLEKETMMHALHHHLHERFLDGCRTGRMRWPRLTEPELGEQVHCVFLRVDYGFLRCIDPASKLVYYIVLMGAEIGAVAVVVPQANRVFGYSTGAPSIYLNILRLEPANLAVALARQMIEGPVEFCDWFNQMPDRFVTFTWPEGAAHLGHFLWNEASGFEIMVAALEPKDFPVVYNLAGAAGYEFYAPLENLYPELRGRVDTRFDRFDTMLEHCYRNNEQPIRFSAHTVTAAIRRRVMAVVADDPEVAILARMGGPRLDPSIPVIVLGLRLSDRTHADLGGFYARVIRHLLHQTPRLAKGLTVVIDGLNARPGRAGVPFRVFSGSDAPTDLYAREKSLVAQLRADTASLPVDIIDCVGVGMRINLFWIDRAQMFIAPWGAGLVKYRWVCNKPGFVFSSRNNLTQPHHLPIYHLPLFMDDPAPIEFANPAQVTDLRAPGELLDADGRDAQEQVGGLSAVNFNFDDPPVLAAIADLFRRTGIAAA